MDEVNSTTSTSRAAGRRAASAISPDPPAGPNGRSRTVYFPLPSFGRPYSCTAMRRIHARGGSLHHLFPPIRFGQHGVDPLRLSAELRDDTFGVVAVLINTREQARVRLSAIATQRTLWISSPIDCRYVLQPDGIPKGACWNTASIRRILPFSILNSSASCHVQLMR